MKQYCPTSTNRDNEVLDLIIYVEGSDCLDWKGQAKWKKYIVLPKLCLHEDCCKKQWG